MSKALSKHRNLIKEFVIDHQQSYFWYDYYMSDEFRSLATEYVMAYVSSHDVRVKEWFDVAGNFVFEKYAKLTLKLPEKKEFEHVIMEDFKQKFAGTNVKLEDCVKFADELREQHRSTLEKFVVEMS